MIIQVIGENNDYKRLFVRTISARLIMPYVDINQLYRYLANEYILYGIKSDIALDIQCEGNVVINGHVYNESHPKTIIDDALIKSHSLTLKAKVTAYLMQYLKKYDLIIDQGCEPSVDIKDQSLKILITDTPKKHFKFPFKTSEEDDINFSDNVYDLVINSTATSICSASESTLYQYFTKLSTHVADNHIKICSVRSYNNTLMCDLALPQHYWCYFNTLPWLSFTYNVDVKTLPNEVALIPFVALLAPIVWSTGLTLELDTLDSTFYESLTKIKDLFSLYYRVSLNGIIKPQKLYYHNNLNDNHMIYYSGGVDATMTLLDLKDRIKDILIMKGFDRPLEEMIKKQSKLYFYRIIPIKDKTLIFVESPNLHNINYTRLNTDFEVYESGMNYWCCYCVGLFTFANAVIPAYLRNNYNIVLSSSYKDEENVIYGASKIIIEHIQTSFCRMLSYGDNYSRMDKLKRIIQYKEAHSKVVLRVCKKGGIPNNCCQCEKCARTILGLYVLGETPANWGFNVSEEEFFKWLRTYIYTFTFSCVDDWIEIIEYIRNSNALSEDQNLGWTLTLDIENIKANNLLLRDNNKKLNW